MRNAEEIFQRILGVRGGTLAALKDRTDQDVKNVRSRYLAARLLYEIRPDLGFVQTMLDCSYRFTDRANRLAMEDKEFRQQLDELKGIVTPAEPGDETPSDLDAKTSNGHNTGRASEAPSESIEQKIKRLANVAFNVDSAPEGNRRKRQLKYATLTVAYIGRWVLGKSVDETAELIGVMDSTIDAKLRVAREEYETQDKVYEAVHMICDDLGLTVNGSR